jgi:hypothetical protein
LRSAAKRGLRLCCVGEFCWRVSAICARLALSLLNLPCFFRNTVFNSRLSATHATHGPYHLP